MDSPGLLSFPLPMLTALLCASLSVLAWRWPIGPRRAKLIFAILFALCAVQGLLVGLRFGYGIDGFVSVQRLQPLLLGPLIYLGFSALTADAREFIHRVGLHLLPTLLVAVLFSVFVTDWAGLDIIIGASYLIYAAALARLWRSRGDALVHARVEAIPSLQRWMLRGIFLLLFLLVLDSAIALDFAFTGGSFAPILISFGNVPLVLVLLGVLVAGPRAVDRVSVRPQPPRSAPEPSAELAAALDKLMAEEKLFLDAALTVERLAKRVHLPTRDVSRAINDAKGMNVSQYVNNFRVAHAAELLLNSRASAKEIAETSGFLARSNFYREFQRVYGTSPASFRKTANPTTDAARPG